MPTIDFTALIAQVDFGTVIEVLLFVFGAIAALAVLQAGIRILIAAVVGNRTEYGGRFWDNEVYDDAMQRLVDFKSAGGRLDRESASAYRKWEQRQAERHFDEGGF